MAGRGRHRTVARAQATAANGEKKTGSAGGPTTSACSALRMAQHSAGGFQRLSCVLVRALRVNIRPRSYYHDISTITYDYNFFTDRSTAENFGSLATRRRLIYVNNRHKRYTRDRFSDVFFHYAKIRAGCVRPLTRDKSVFSNSATTMRRCWSRLARIANNCGSRAATMRILLCVFVVFLSGWWF